MELTRDQALQKAVEAHKAGKIQEADRLYKSILKAQPKHPDANHNMGVLAVGVGKVEEALPFFKTALEANVSIGQYWLSYINTLIKLDRMPEVKAVFDQAKDKGVKGDAFDQLEKRLSELSVSESKSQDPDPSSEQLQPIISLYTKGQLQNALSEISQMLERFPNSVVLYNIAGASNAGLMQFDAAITCYKEALKIKPDYADAYNNMGVALKSKGDLEAAIESYKEALKIKPDYADAYNNMGTALKEKGDLDVAIDSYKKATKIKPDYAGAHYNLGVALQKLGRLDEAEASYKQSIALKSDYAEAHSNLGVTLQKLGRLDEAEVSYRQAIDNNAKMGDAYLGLSHTLRQCGNIEESSGIQIKGLELTSVEIVSNSNLKTVIPKFVNKMQEQNGIPTFFDNYVFSHLTNKLNLAADICGIFEDGQLSKDNRFVSFSQRVKTIPASMPSGRLFDGIPFASSQGIHSLIKWKEHSLYKTSSDLVLYWMILQDVKPDVIIELGSGDGGSAIWLADIARALGLDTHVYSYDINKPNLSHERVTFIEYDLMKINQQSKPPCWESFLGGKLLIEDAHVNLKNVLNLFDNILSKDDYLIVEDSDAKQEIIKDFAGEKEPKYKLDQFFLDFFGKNITCSKNSIFKVF